MLKNWGAVTGCDYINKYIFHWHSNLLTVSVQGALQNQILRSGGNQVFFSNQHTVFRDNRTSWDNLPSNNFHILKCCFELLEWFKLLLLILARLWRAFFNSCFIFFKNHVANYLSALTWLWNTKIIFSQDSTYQQLQQPTCNLQRMCSNCGSISPFTDSKTKLVADLSQNCIEFKNCFIYVQN